MRAHEKDEGGYKREGMYIHGTIDAWNMTAQGSTRSPNRLRVNPQFLVASSCHVAPGEGDRQRAAQVEGEARRCCHAGKSKSAPRPARKSLRSPNVYLQCIRLRIFVSISRVFISCMCVQVCRRPCPDLHGPVSLTPPTYSIAAVFSRGRRSWQK